MSDKTDGKMMEWFKRQGATFILVAAVGGGGLKIADTNAGLINNNLSHLSENVERNRMEQQDEMHQLKQEMRDNKSEWRDSVRELSESMSRIGNDSIDLKARMRAMEDWRIEHQREDDRLFNMRKQQ